MLPQLRIKKEARMLYDADTSNYNVYIKSLLIQLHLIPLIVSKCSHKHDNYIFTYCHYPI